MSALKQRVFATVAAITMTVMAGGAAVAQDVRRVGYGYVLVPVPAYVPAYGPGSILLPPCNNWGVAPFDRRPLPDFADASGHCAQNFPSYDPVAGTYAGSDGLQHRCP